MFCRIVPVRHKTREVLCKFSIFILNQFFCRSKLSAEINENNRLKREGESRDAELRQTQESCKNSITEIKEKLLEQLNENSILSSKLEFVSRKLTREKQERSQLQIDVEMLKKQKSQVCHKLDKVKSELSEITLQINQPSFPTRILRVDEPAAIMETGTLRISL